MSIFQVLALALMLLFYGCYGLKMLNQRSHGIKTDHMGEGKVGLTRGIEISLKVVTILVPIVELVSIIMNICLSPAWIRWVGVCLGAFGVAVFIIAVITMRDSWRAGVSKEEKTELVTSGIFQISRNPAFLGFDLLYAGILLMFFNVPLCIITLLGGLLFHLQIVNVEEDFLLQEFGKDYVQYKKTVCRYFGKRFSRSAS